MSQSRPRIEDDVPDSLDDQPVHLLRKSYVLMPTQEAPAMKPCGLRYEAVRKNLRGIAHLILGAWARGEWGSLRTLGMARERAQRYKSSRKAAPRSNAPPSLPRRRGNLPLGEG